METRSRSKRLPIHRQAAARFLRLAIVIVVGMTLGALRAEAAVECKNPWQLADEINAVVNTGQPLDACDWRAALDRWDPAPSVDRWRFRCWKDGCSENLPLLAAVVAVMYEPIQGGHDMRQWFLIFLKAQLNQTVTEQSVPPNLKFFKGTEMLAPIYDGWSAMAVMSAYYWSQRMQPTAPFAGHIRTRADDYLRATFYLWGLTTGKNNVSSEFKNDAMFAGASPSELYPVAAAGPRAGGTELTNSRTWLFAKVAGLSSNAWRRPSLETLYNTLKTDWSAVDGLNGTQRLYLRNLVQHHQLPGNFSAVVGHLKMARNMHFVIWNGDRLSFIEGNAPNTNKAAVFAQAYYFHPHKTAAGKEVHFLYPFTGLASGKNATLTIDAPGSRLKAVSQQMTAYLSVPTARPVRYHVRLGPTGLTFCSGALTC